MAFDPIDVQVGSNIRRLREDRGISQKQLAAGAGISFQQVQKYESGANRISASRIVQVCEFFRVQVTALFAGTMDGMPKARQPSEHSRTALDMAIAFEKLDHVGTRRALINLVKAIGNG